MFTRNKRGGPSVPNWNVFRPCAEAFAGRLDEGFAEGPEPVEEHGPRRLVFRSRQRGQVLVGKGPRCESLQVAHFAEGFDVHTDGAAGKRDGHEAAYGSR